VGADAGIVSIFYNGIGLFFVRSYKTNLIHPE
jgi:hypothetical protein